MSTNKSDKQPQRLSKLLNIFKRSKGNAEIYVNKHNFQKLTPINNADLEIYSDALDFVFASSELKNIALSGAYSAGKSSIIDSYKAKNQDIKFVHISLAHFKDIDNATDSTKGASEYAVQDSLDDEETGDIGYGAEKLTANVTSLEGKILNQLIHQIKSEDIPQTHFRTKRQYYTRHAVTPSLIITVLVLALLYMFFFDGWYNYVYEFSEGWFRNVLRASTNDITRLIVGVFCTTISVVLLFKLIKLQLNRRIFNFKRFGAGNLDIEIFEDSNDSYFDKYLNEVLYLFDNSRADAIVFEDLDRYNAILVFQRLREINNLVNAQRIERDGVSYKPLRFFYLLRDDIFDSKDRTKFFDYIVPVIPVIDGSNAYDQFIRHLKIGGVFEKFTQSFLKDLSLYIDDMRLLKNIYNEFMVYHGRLNSIGLNYDKMLAMIAYKNLFPNDFSNLPLRKGFVFALFAKKDSFISSKKQALLGKQKKAEIALENAKKETLNRAEEWNIIYNDRRQKITAKYRNVHYSSHPDYDNRKKEYEELETESEERKEAIENRTGNNIPNIETEIARLKMEISRVSSNQLKNIITRENRATIFDVKTKNDVGIEEDFSGVRGSNYFDLLKYLISRGYIDETYNDYITYFYPESLSYADKVFLLSVSNQSKLEYSYNLKEPEKVANGLNIFAFDDPEVLNFDLMFYLLKNSTKRKSFLDGFFSQLQRNKNFDYVQAVMIFTKDWQINDSRLVSFINQLNASWSSFLQDSMKGARLSEACRDRFVLSTLYYTPKESLLIINKGGYLTNFISGKSDFLNIEEPDVARILSRFNTLGVSFKSIDYDKSDSALFRGVYEQSLYELTFENISLMLVRMYSLNDSEDFRHKNYTLILGNPESPLSGYITANFKDYMDVVLLCCYNKIADDEAQVLDVLNSEYLNANYKEQYIGSLVTIIDNLKNVDDIRLWKPLVEKSLIPHTEKNVLDYHISCEQQLNAELVSFINSSPKILNFASVRGNYKDEEIGAFFRSVIVCNKLNSNQYRSILVSLNRVYSSGFAIESIEEDKMLILVDASIIKMHGNALVFLRKHYPKAVLNYIKRNILKYLEIIGSLVDDEPLFDFNEMLSVLGSDVSDTHKLKLIEHTNEKISVKNKGYTDVLMAHIVGNNNYFMESDLDWLLANYNNQGPKSKTTIETLAIKETNNLFVREAKIPVEIFHNLLNGSQSGQINKAKVFALALPHFNDEQCKQYIPLVNLKGDYISIFDGKRPLIPMGEVHERILTIFKKKNWITKFEPDEKNDDHYRVIGRKSRISAILDFLD